MEVYNPIFTAKVIDEARVLLSQKARIEALAVLIPVGYLYGIKVILTDAVTAPQVVHLTEQEAERYKAYERLIAEAETLLGVGACADDLIVVTNDHE